MRRTVLGTILVVSLIFVFPLIGQTNPTENTKNSWLSGWEYRKSHVIESAPGAGQNYTINITVINGTSIDSGDTVYINNKMRSDFGDIRFTRDDGVTQLSYWIETKNDQENATFWIKIPDDLSTSNVTIYIYYGAPSATTTSNIDNTFIFGDDFEGNLSKWSSIQGDCETSTDYAYEGSKSLKVGTGVSGVYNVVNWSNVAVHVRFYDSLAPGIEEQFLFADPPVGGARAGVSGDIDPTHYIYYVGLSYSVSDILRTVGWHSFVVRCCATGEDVVIDGNVQPYTAAVNSVGVVKLGSAWTANAEVAYFDAFFVCRYVNPEPTQGGWGSEQRTITVPDDYPTIQAAINAASDGDTVFVRSGSYYEHLIVNASVALVGEDRNSTVIDGSGDGEIVDIQANNVYIGNFTLQDAGIGTYGAVWVQGCSNAVICSNTMIDNHHGVSVPTGALNVTISGNLIYNRQPSYADGIRLGSSGTLVTGNTVINESTGIGLDWANDNIISNNTVTNSSIGIGAGNPSFNNTFSENTIANNSYGFLIAIYNSTFFHNNVINNSIQASFYSSSYANVWDNGYPSGGNYWSDYTGVDMKIGPYQNETGSDGIGDSPYTIDANNTDNYPLMNPWTSPDIAVTNLTSAKTVIGQGYTVSVNVNFENLGNKIEAFNATVYANSTCILSEQTMLAVTNHTLSFILDTTGFTYGNYTITASAEFDPSENATTNNCTCSAIVTIPGDVNGDGRVFLSDLGAMAAAWCSTPTSSNWNPNADIVGEGQVFLGSLAVMAAHWNQRWTPP